MTARHLQRVVAVATSALILNVSAATFRVDDSASFPGEALVGVRWQSLTPGRMASNDVEGTLAVNIRLNTQPWRGKPGRIYMTLQPHAVQSLRVEWTTGGVLQPGTLRPGGRTLVYAGPVRDVTMADQLRVVVRADGREYATTQRLEFQFEIDVD